MVPVREMIFLSLYVLMKSSRILITSALVVCFNIEQVCRNAALHLRGNVYVHYVSRDSAVAAYNHMNGRFYAKKQVSRLYCPRF